MIALPGVVAVPVQVQVQHQRRQRTALPQPRQLAAGQNAFEEVEQTSIGEQFFNDLQQATEGDVLEGVLDVRGQPDESLFGATQVLRKCQGVQRPAPLTEAQRVGTEQRVEECVQDQVDRSLNDPVLNVLEYQRALPVPGAFIDPHNLLGAGVILPCLNRVSKAAAESPYLGGRVVGIAPFVGAGSLPTPASEIVSGHPQGACIGDAFHQIGCK